MTSREILAWFTAQSIIMEKARNVSSVYPVVYDRLMYRAMVNALKTHNNELIKMSREGFARSGPGALVIDFTTIPDLVKGSAGTLRYVPLSDLRQTCTKKITWSTYERLDYHDNFVLCVKCVDVDGMVRWHTAAFNDDGGDCDVAQVEDHIKRVTSDLCWQCRKKDAPACRCRKCGRFMWYCNKECREAEAPHHAIICDPNLNGL